MAKWPLGCVAAGVFGIVVVTLPVRAQLPTMSDVDRGGESAAAGPLGLKLVPGKGPVETLVVDAAEKPEAD